MKDYDFAFSLGAACSCSQALREAGLQFVSSPFDWVGSPSVLKSVEALAGEFDGWFRKDDLDLVDVRREPLSTQCFINRKTGFAFYHEFCLDQPFDALYPVVAERFHRRGMRLLDNLRNSRTALAVYVEAPFREQGTDADFVAARRRLAEAFPRTEISLMAFRKARSGTAPLVLTPAPGVTVLELDFVQYEDGVVSHEVDRSYFTRYLKENCRVADVRTEAEKARFAEFKCTEREKRWGDGGPGRALVNRIAYKTYRRLARYLVSQRVIPPEKPIRY